MSPWNASAVTSSSVAIRALRPNRPITGCPDWSAPSLWHASHEVRMNSGPRPSAGPERQAEQPVAVVEPRDVVGGEAVDRDVGGVDERAAGVGRDRCLRGAGCGEEQGGPARQHE
jgi:hypothetical protein